MNQASQIHKCIESVEKTTSDLNHLNHRDFIKHLSKKALTANGDPKFKAKRYQRPINSSPSDAAGFTKVNSATDSIIAPELNLHPESVAFLFHIDGCAKNLLFYLIIHELNTLNGHYSFNVKIVAQFSKYSEELFGMKYTDSTIQQAHRKLEQKNVTTNISKGKYFLNPLIAGGKNEAARRELLSAYSRLLESKPQKDEYADLYPIYKV